MALLSGVEAEALLSGAGVVALLLRVGVELPVHQDT